MADLELTLSWLGMTKYLDRFVEAGFDSWATVLEITEDDLEYLNVDLGHRRKLQREIANTKRLAQDPGFVQPLYGITAQASQQLSSMAGSNDYQQMSAPAKRGYRHHPKPDSNAPERPYSAYVMFCNITRNQLKEQDQNLSFAELSKKSGEKWRALSSRELEMWKQRAAVPWQKFKAEVAEYKKTDGYQEYERYLVDFKASQAGKTSERRMSMSQQQQSPVSPKRSLEYAARPGGSPADPSLVRPGLPRRQTAPNSGPQKTLKQTPSNVALKRFKKDNEGWSSSQRTKQPTMRGGRSCTSCRARKNKCHGEKPECRNCRELGIDCQYDISKRDKKQMQMDNLYEKLKAYETLLLQSIPHVDEEDQQAIHDALLLPPELESSKEAKNRAMRSTSVGQDFDDGESQASGIGSMGSTDRVNQDDFMPEENEDHALAFAGPTSETKWIRRLKQELGKDNKAGKPKAGQQDPLGFRGISQRPSGLNREDMDTAIVGHQIDPFQLPLKNTADALVNAYFSTVQSSFPILDRSEFMYQYEELFSTMDPASYGDRTFFALLQLVFAISAVHAHLTEADWAGDGRDHMLHFAQARMLAVDTGILNDTCFLGQTQVFGLGGMYLLVTDQINRAWNITGLAVRSAQSLGLHLKNTTPGVAPVKKRHYAKLWFAVASLESMLTVMTGRPTMVNPRDCSVSVPRDRSAEDSLSETSSSERSQQAGFRDQQGSASTSELNEGSDSSRLSRESSLTPVGARFFTHYTDICALAKEVVGALYYPGIRRKKWSEIQTIISNFDKRLIAWREHLSTPFDNADASPDLEIESCRVALRIAFHSTRTIINRPCLCRLDERIVDQSANSKGTNRAFAGKCVDSARAVLRLVLYKPDSTILRRGAIWWMLLHHLKRALTVSLLELAFRAEHMPANADEILVEAKDAIKWLRWHSASSPTARRTWVTMSRLLNLAARKVGRDTSDIVTSHGSEEMSDSSTQPPQQPQTRSDTIATDPLEVYDGGEEQYLGDFTERSEWDHFGFLREEGGMGSFFPTASEIERMGQDEGDDMQVYGYEQRQQDFGFEAQGKGGGYGRDAF